LQTLTSARIDRKGRRSPAEFARLTGGSVRVPEKGKRDGGLKGFARWGEKDQESDSRTRGRKKGPLERN